METLIIWEQVPFNKVKWEWIIEKDSVSQALSYLYENKWKIANIIIKNIPCINSSSWWYRLFRI